MIMGLSGHLGAAERNMLILYEYNCLFGVKLIQFFHIQLSLIDQNGQLMKCKCFKEANSVSSIVNKTAGEYHVLVLSH